MVRSRCEGGKEWLREWGTSAATKLCASFTTSRAGPPSSSGPNEGDHGENLAVLCSVCFSASLLVKRACADYLYTTGAYAMREGRVNFVNRRHDLSDRPDCYVITDLIAKRLLEFILDRLRDTDVRVRLLVVSKLPIFFDFFREDAMKLYDALAGASPKELLQAVKLGIQSLRNTESPMEAKESVAMVNTTAVAIAKLGVSNAALRQRALLDIIVMCQIYATSSSPSYSSHFYSLLYRIIGVMASDAGYSVSREIVLDHIRWILHTWLDTWLPQDFLATARRQL